jgi:hypothetical protein
LVVLDRVDDDKDGEASPVSRVFVCGFAADWGGTRTILTVPALALAGSGPAVVSRCPSLGRVMLAAAFRNPLLMSESAFRKSSRGSDAGTCVPRP